MSDPRKLSDFRLVVEPSHQVIDFATLGLTRPPKGFSEDVGRPFHLFVVQRVKEVLEFHSGSAVIHQELIEQNHIEGGKIVGGGVVQLVEGNPLFVGEGSTVFDWVPGYCQYLYAQMLREILLCTRADLTIDGVKTNTKGSFDKKTRDNPDKWNEFWKLLEVPEMQ